MGAIFDNAKEQWALMRRDFDDYVESRYLIALEECSGVLVNHLGISKGIDGYSLFTGPWLRAKKYASEELLEHWEKRGRMTMEEYETQWFEASIGAYL